MPSISGFPHYLIFAFISHRILCINALYIGLSSLLVNNVKIFNYNEHCNSYQCPLYRAFLITANELDFKSELLEYQCPLYRAFLITTVKKDFWGKDDDLVLKQVSMPSISGFPHYSQRINLIYNSVPVTEICINALYIGLSSLQGLPEASS